MRRQEQPDPVASPRQGGVSLSLPGLLAGFSRQTLGTDVLAGLAVSAIVVPQSMAYAEIAGLPPQAGVFVSFAAPLASALLGTSRQLICGPSSATAAISAAHMASLAAGSSTVFARLSAALAIVFIGSSESTTIARRYADLHHYEIKPNREFLAIGVSGIASGLVHGFVTSGGASQSAANDRAGARSQVSSLVVSGMALLAATLLLPFIATMPHAVLSAIVVNAVRGFISVPAMRDIWRVDRASFGIAMIAVMGVLVFGILTGLVLAVGMSVFGLLIRFSRPRVTVLPQS